MTYKFKIIIVDDHELFRHGVNAVVSKTENIEIVGEAINGINLMELLKTTEPDAILMDIKMPEMNGIEATKAVHEKYPQITIVGLSMFGDENYLEEMLSAGARGFILKNTNANGLRTALKTIAEGQPYFAEEFMPYFANKYINGKPEAEKEILSLREIEVLQLIANGLTNKEIAETLFISPKTVANHRASLISKTGSKNTITLLSYALKKNLIKM